MRRSWVPRLSLIGVTALSACVDAGGLIEAEPGDALSTDAVFAVQATVLTVAPSGDAQGVTDANNIEAALNAAKANGDVVYLTDGDASTVDHYYTSRNVVVAGFKGVLRGEGMGNTVIHAGRKSAAPGDGFAPAFSPWWTQAGSATDQLPNVLQFDVPSGSVTVSDLTIEAKDDSPTDLIPDYYGNDASYILTLIEILGGDHDTRIENVRLEGKEAGAQGSLGGMNVDIGVHVMLGTPFGVGTGNLVVKNIEVANVFEAVLFMRYQGGSTIELDGIGARNVRRGVWSTQIFDSSVRISNSHIALRPGGWEGMLLLGIASGLELTGNTFTGSGVGIASVFTGDATIVGNTFKNFGADHWSGAALLLWGAHGNRVSGNHFENVSGGFAGIRLGAGSGGNTIDHNVFGSSGLPGWTASSPAGPGALVLDANTSDNTVFEMKFPAGTGKALCQMVWDLTDDPSTTGYDGTNSIHNWKPCENLAERDARWLARSSSQTFPGSRF